MTGQALGVGVERFASRDAIRCHRRWRRNRDYLDLLTIPEGAVEALDILEDLEPLLHRHVLEARHDAMTAQADRHRATLASYALREGPEEVGRRWELSRRRRAELELGAGEVSRL